MPGFNRFTYAVAGISLALVLGVAAQALAGPFEDAVQLSNQGDYSGALDALRPEVEIGYPDRPEDWNIDARIAFVIVADKLSDQLWNNSAPPETVSSHAADFMLAYEIAKVHAESDAFANWGMRYYLGKMYLTGTGVAENGELSEGLLRQVADSGDPQYDARAKDLLCYELALEEYC